MEISVQTKASTVYTGDCVDVLGELGDETVSCCITSPPYWGLRDYGMQGQIGVEDTPEEYVSRIVEVFGQVRRVLKSDGTLWLNLGDTYVGGGRGGDPKMRSHAVESSADKVGRTTKSSASLPAKSLVGIPWRVALALQSDGWILRQDIVWNKPNVMPEPVKDRCTKSHEYLFLFAKSGRYYFDSDAIRERCSEENIKDFERRKTMDNKAGEYGDVRPDLTRDRREYMPEDYMRNRRSVWSVNTKPYKGAHFATWPQDLVKPCVLAGCPEGGVVLDPFHGSGTTGVVANKCGAKYIGIELNPEYVDLSSSRLAQGYLFG